MERHIHQQQVDTGSHLALVVFVLRFLCHYECLLYCYDYISQKAHFVKRKVEGYAVILMCFFASVQKTKDLALKILQK
jgi:hypothetical protein